ncbi:transposase [Longimonas halophila]|uniref:Transposase n=1 Tax=Longimonas halophila TaxID=1469170 RepID=A0A2H3NYJ9_9BACT|nr:transposase [Longimonas halophila]PEN07877.1 transposase [Longimonas halophila]
MALPFCIHDEQAPHFLTCTILNGWPVLARPAAAQVVLDALQHMQETERIHLYAYVLMANHIHLIASADTLSREVHALKSFTAHRIVDVLSEQKATHVLHLLQWSRRARRPDRTYQVWTAGSYPKQLQTATMTRQKIAYIHDNPVRRGYVDEATHWRYSSARNYAGQPGLIDVTVADLF